MRILAIRGGNLASLAGSFAIDFRTEPLSSTGLFAICGPTGAGKSTLLDALCLALYEATPRLSRAGARGIALPDVKDETVTPQDVRNLLRRGAAEGHAEVEFIGNDGVAYRARWSVRRARNRPDGRLQESEMRLWRLPEEQQIGGKNVEVKAEIVRRIGLNFDQFTRAVLLAQNEFSAFLKANDNERGELLETLTGSGIYAEISRLAFERAKEETALLERHGARLADAAPLSEEERRALENEVSDVRAQLTRHEARHATLQRHLGWLREAHALDAALNEARELRESRQEECRKAQGRRAHLAEVEAVQSARPLLEQIRRLANENARCSTAIATARMRLETARAAELVAQQTRDRATTALQAAQAEHAQRLLLLNAARSLDARIDALLPEHAQSRRHADDATAAAMAARGALEQKGSERTALGAQMQQLDAWLAAHADDAALAAQWQRCDILLSQAQEAAQKAAHAATEASNAVRRQEDELAIEERHAATHAAAVQTLEQRRTERDACTQRLRVLDAARLAGERARLAQDQQQLIEAERLCRTLHDTQVRRTEALADMMRHAETLAAAQRAWQTAQAEQAGVAAALAQAERMQRRAELASSASVLQLRAGLSDGEACPVCGAAEHPYRHTDPQAKAMLAGLADEVATCREAMRRNTEARATQRALADAALLAQTQAEARIAEQDAALTDTERAWRAHALFGTDPALSAPAHACASWLTQRQGDIAQRIREIDAAEAAYAAAAVERDGAQTAVDTAAAQAEFCRVALDRARQATAEAARLLIAVRERERDAHARADASLDALDTMPLPRDWRTAWHAAPAAFHARCRDAVTAFDAHSRQRAEALSRCAALDAELQALSERSASTAAERDRAVEAHAARDAALQATRRERQSLFDGRPAAEVEAEMAATLNAARGALDAAVAAAQAAALDARACTEAHERAQERLEELAAQTREGDGRIAEWLHMHNAHHARCASGDPVPLQAAAPLDLQALTALLEHDADWIRAERVSLAALDAALAQAETVHSERERRCLAHRQAWQSDWTERTDTEVEADLEALRGEIEGVRTRLSTLQLSQSEDDRRRSESADMRAQLEQQQAIQRRWAQLAELIGSADGKKFRNYAQQTTLDVLLAYANRHLADLARRYRLERVRDTLALLVVDGDMGAEMRSVHSLSGGESFLVSLALALGLASLSSNGVRVESLFIDEGFGSLDADTLRVAMDALDGLQAMGRRVGVISHVQEMTERITTRIVVRRVSGGSSHVSVAQAY
ncbi:AAA family ATPase [Noviherbaspirillum pedocola]|uniref:AAA family ATPase n=1 Tax=Noviherbaspirillum pedocola TaxID=2801341 RepID=A0A934W1W5_9BURK|nr:AAA family ATPase [Noviherbaspirillum pedocola]MBK4735656.1 AAA family ATPase [Noviherbaspirillum pedocola]